MSDTAVVGNRWDLLPLDPNIVPVVSVVVVHYEQARQLRLTLAALQDQTLPPCEIIVSDDGSDRVPEVQGGRIPVRLVRQEDLGFRAAAARNHGARQAKGEVLVFLDADTVPSRECIGKLVQRVTASRDVMAVGSRLHADLSAMDPGTDPAEQPRLPDPEWLHDGYAASRNLLDADGRSYRFVISAIVACRTSLFNELGGFDERFDRYGGEDWDFAFRAWNSGAILVHEPEAIAFHDGPQRAAGGDTAEIVDCQALKLAALIPEPQTRGADIGWARPDVLVDIPSGLTTSEIARIVHSLLRQTARDLLIRVDTNKDLLLAELYGPLLSDRPWTFDQKHRARARLTISAPIPRTALGRAMKALTENDLGSVSLSTEGIVVAILRATRSIARAKRWHPDSSSESDLSPLFDAFEMDIGACPPSRSDLGGYFAAGEG